MDEHRLALWAGSRLLRHEIGLCRAIGALIVSSKMCSRWMSGEMMLTGPQCVLVHLGVVITLPWLHVVCRTQASSSILVRSS